MHVDHAQTTLSSFGGIQFRGIEAFAVVTYDDGQSSLAYRQFNPHVPGLSVLFDVDHGLLDYGKDLFFCPARQPLGESASFQRYRESLRVLDLPGVKLQSRYQALRLQSDGSQVEEERTHLFQGAIDDRHHVGQFLVHIFRLVNQQLARELQTHSDGCQQLRGTVVQVASQPLAHTLFQTDDALFFFSQCLHQSSVLDGGCRLCRKGPQQFHVGLVELLAACLVEDLKHTNHVTPGNEREADDAGGVEMTTLKPPVPALILAHVVYDERVARGQHPTGNTLVFGHTLML